MSYNRPDEILQTLHANGHEAYYVGGCVRDTLLNRPIHDWDITTSAKPEEILLCFAKCIPTGISHGTVTVLQSGFQAEVTTYRTDGTYSDSRHPEQVTFVSSLTEDLARRDFTINAMAMDIAGAIIDKYGGKDDLKDHLIRCVGDPDLRFREDALRMLRAVRFSAQLGFEIEEHTLVAIRKNAGLSRELSAERVRDEVEKTLCSSAPWQLGLMADTGLLERCCPEQGCDYGWIAALPPIPTVRWAALCRCWPRMKLKDMRLSKKMIQDAMAASCAQIPQNEIGWKRLIAQSGAEVSLIVAALAGQTELVERILHSGQCLSLSQLAVNGADFPALRGPELGKHLQRLLFHVLAHPEENSREILLKLYRE